MTEPTTVAAGAIATASTVTLAILGVDYYSLIWAMVGTLLALYQAERMGRVRSVIYVTLSTLVGAAVGTGTMSFFTSESRGMLIVVSCVSGFGAQVIVTALLKAGVHRIKKLGGE